MRQLQSIQTVKKTRGLAELWVIVTVLVLWIQGVLTGYVSAADVPDLPFVYSEWEMFYAGKEGLPNDHIFSLHADNDRLWVGTEGGLALYENRKWKAWTEKEGLPWKVVAGIDVSEKTGDVWLALFGGGLVRFTGGRFDQFTQMNSGLANDVLYGVAVLDDTVWAATAAGISSYNTVSGEWRIFNEKNAPMEEIWCYHVNANSGKVFVAVWGGGVLEWDEADQRWDAHRDPDREMEIDLFRDDGLIHIITTAVSYVDSTLWAATYFGLSRYDGRTWRGYMDHDSGLVSNFINFTVGRDKSSCYVATDKGLSVLSDFDTDTWVTYKRAAEDATEWTAHVNRGKDEVATRQTNLTLPNHFVISVELQKNDVWIGTGHGLARGNGTHFFPGVASTKAEDE